MLSLNIQAQNINFKDIKFEHLPQILNWYNKIDDFKFATGIDHPMTLEMLIWKYSEMSNCTNEFFVGIYCPYEQKMIGILKGRLEFENNYSVWISSIVIDSLYQNKGYGSVAINVLLDHLKRFNNIRDAYLAVVEVNNHGICFWNKNNFCKVKKIQNHIKLQNKQQNIIIMHKIL